MPAPHSCPENRARHVLSQPYSINRIDTIQPKRDTRKTRKAIPGSFAMSYMMWLPFVVLAGWAAGEIAGDGGCGRVSDILLGLSGAFLVRFLVERFEIPLPDIYLLLFSVWGAALLPIAARWVARHRRHDQQDEGVIVARLIH